MFRLADGCSSLASSAVRWPINEWNAQYEEDAVDPEIEVLDAHHHLFDFKTHDKGLPIPKWVIKLTYLQHPGYFESFTRSCL